MDQQFNIDLHISFYVILPNKWFMLAEGINQEQASSAIFYYNDCVYYGNMTFDLPIKIYKPIC